MRFSCVSYKNRLSVLILKNSTLHVYWFLRFFPPSTPCLLELCTSFFQKIPPSTFSDLATFALPPRLFQPPRLLKRWEYVLSDSCSSGAPFRIDLRHAIHLAHTARRFKLSQVYHSLFSIRTYCSIPYSRSWWYQLFLTLLKHNKNGYCKVASSNTSHLEAHADFFRGFSNLLYCDLLTKSWFPN